MAHVLPPLPYDYNALEPHIDETTMRIHHDKHHGTYVTNLNTALENQADLQAKSIEDLMAAVTSLPEPIRTTVRNNGGGHYNHTLFWELMAPGGSKEPEGALANQIESDFGGLAGFKDQFQKAGLGRFGSGWVWLVQDRSGKLAIESTPNQDNPVMDGKYPVLGCDVWEHAYYLKYQNRRADYLGAWWNVLNWTAAGRRFRG